MKKFFLPILLVVSCLVSFAQEIVQDSLIIKASKVTPSLRQLKWQQMETNAFVHFGLYTYVENVDGAKYNPSSFNPINFDADQWCSFFKKAGFKGVVLTAKHHEGFCLWPSKFTDYSVKSSPWRDGKGDVVKEVAESCKKYGLKFGIYLSPWDIHEPTYGSPAYDDFFVGQLTELLTSYGDIFEVWFDGYVDKKLADKVQDYDWDRYYETVRKLQPDAVIAIVGPDVRWVGNESGLGHETEWSVVPIDLSTPHHDRLYHGFEPTKNNIGSREDIVENGKDMIWYPAEVDVPIRPGWGYKKVEDYQVASLQKMLGYYYSSVGMNAVLLLNYGPTPDGLIYQNDIDRTMEWRRVLDKTFSKNFINGADIFAEGSLIDNKEVKKLADGDISTGYSVKNTKGVAEFIIDMKSYKLLNVLMLQEDITKGQRIEEFALDAWSDRLSDWVPVVSGSTVGYKRLLKFGTINTAKLRIRIEKSRGIPVLSEIGIFYEPRVIDYLK